MSTITDASTLFNLTQLIAWTGQYSGSTGTQDMAGFFTTSSANYVQTAAVVDVNSDFKLTHGFTTYFKMQGYNLATQKYEVWYSIGAPQLTNPSGNALVSVSVVLTWTDR